MVISFVYLVPVRLLRSSRANLFLASKGPLSRDVFDVAQSKVWGDTAENRLVTTIQRSTGVKGKKDCISKELPSLRFWVMGLKTRNSSDIMSWLPPQRKELVKRVIWKHRSHDEYMNFIYITPSNVEMTEKRTIAAKYANYTVARRKAWKKECIEFEEKMGDGRYRTFAQKVTR